MYLLRPLWRYLYTKVVLPTHAVMLLVIGLDEYAYPSTVPYDWLVNDDSVSLTSCTARELTIILCYFVKIFTGPKDILTL